MKNIVNHKTVIFLTALIASAVFIGCQNMDNAMHNTEDGRTGTSGHALTMRLNPSRIPSNSGSSLNAHIRFVDLSDMSPVANARVRLALEHPVGSFMEDKVAGFADGKLFADVITDAKGEANINIYAGDLCKWIPEVTFGLDAQSTIEYEKGNSLEYFAQEWFHIYNPHWDGTEPPNRAGPTAVINIFPQSGADLDTVITFDGSGSYDVEGDLGFGIVTYDWYLGDGTFKRGKVVHHTYSAYDEYTVTLRVTNRLGLVGQAEETIELGDPDDDDEEDPDPNYAVSGAGIFNLNGDYYRDDDIIRNGVHAYEHENGSYWLFRVFYPGDEDLAAGNYWVFRTTLPPEDDSEVINPEITIYYHMSSTAVPYEGTYQVGYQGIAPGARVQRY